VSEEKDPDAPAGPFAEPRIAINRVYTKKGDLGQTSLVGGQKVSKDELRIEAYGTVDELNSVVGIARESTREASRSAPNEGRRALEELGAILLRVQHELFNLGSILATLPEDVHEKQPRVTEVEVKALEREIDRCQADLRPLRSFVLPGGSRLNAELHLARTVCRRAERLVVALSKRETVDGATIRYLNRLSDALFVFSRFASRAEGAAETLWEPNASASGSSG
jgi:cob(I)alamin adenosyltransferase